MKTTIIIDGKETCYEITTEGKIFNKKTGRELKGTYARNEYHSVQLIIDGKPRTLMTHRLVAQAFCPNPNNYSIVDHINRNKHDNQAENLRWVTNSINGKNKDKIVKNLIPQKISYVDRRWLPLKIDERYIISDKGEVANKVTGTILKGTYRNGYHRVTIRGKMYSNHCLMWETFIGPIQGVLDHIDGNKLNNELTNLRDITQSENIYNAQKLGHKGQMKITNYSINGEKIKEYSSIQEAANEMGVTHAAIKNASLYGTKSCGYYWLREDSLTTEKEFNSQMSDNVKTFLNLNKTLIDTNGLIYSRTSKHCIPKFKDEKGIYVYLSQKNGKYERIYL